jgi:predicted transcriptional regulator YheO
MSNQYEIDMNIDVSKLHPTGGILMKHVPKEKDEKNPDADFDPRGFKEQTGPEIFEMICSAAIQNANPKCSYQQLQAFRGVSKMMKEGIKDGKFTTNKTNIDIIKNSIKGNPSWPNNDELMGVLDSIMEKLDTSKNNDPV